jgi:hypothetical protein
MRLRRKGGSIPRLDFEMLDPVNRKTGAHRAGHDHVPAIELEDFSGNGLGAREMQCPIVQELPSGTLCEAFGIHHCHAILRAKSSEEAKCSTSVSPAGLTGTGGCQSSRNAASRAPAAFFRGSDRTISALDRTYP